MHWLQKRSIDAAKSQKDFEFSMLQAALAIFASKQFCGANLSLVHFTRAQARWGALQLVFSKCSSVDGKQSSTVKAVGMNIGSWISTYLSILPSVNRFSPDCFGLFWNLSEEVQKSNFRLLHHSTRSGRTGKKSDRCEKIKRAGPNARKARSPNPVFYREAGVPLKHIWKSKS